MSDDYFSSNRSTIAIITGGHARPRAGHRRKARARRAPGVVIGGRNAEKGEGAAEEAPLHTLTKNVANAFAAKRIRSIHQVQFRRAS